MRKPKLLELDIVRGVAIAAVLLIHGTSTPRVELPLGSRSHTLYFAINNLSYFPVQLFVLLSGLVLFYSYYDKWTVRSAPSFYFKRLQFILIPYLLWSCFYYLFDQWLNPAVKVQFSFSDFVSLLPWAEAGYHLYFMTLIMQFYALFPLLVTLAKLWRPLGRYLGWFGVAVQIAVYLYGQYAEQPIPHGDRLFVSYFALFCIGGSIGMNYERLIGWLNRNIWWVTGATASAGFVFLLLSLQAQYGMRLKAYEFELLFNGYPILMALSLIWIGRHLLASAPRLSAVLSSLGAASFGIYFIHPALLGYYSVQMHAVPGQAAYHLTVWGGIALIATVPWAIVSLLKRVKGSWLLFGK
ncbi:acyltransferase [Paenibacillus hodogayensis]|uniref:Acyltransferase n=1 Tax=Paenibacillus hodogayensis TaxID=279208 RepID=A0ABV5VRU2_9BACL